MDDFLNAPCDEDAVDLLYNIFIGRKPEAGHPWVGVPKITVINGLIQSEEFSIKCDVLLRQGFDSIFEGRDARIIDYIPPFLVEMGGSLPRSNTWPDFLLSGIDALNGFLNPDQIPEHARILSEMIANEYKPRPEKAGFFRDLLAFNKEWFLRFNKNVPALRDVSRSELEALAALMVVTGEAEISPFFQIGGLKNRDLRRTIFGTDKKPADFTLDEVISRLKIAFKRGILSHWLFHPGYYESQREQAFATGRIDRWAPQSDPYIDFLENGDLQNIRPHWLFCPTAYKILNPDLTENHSLFRHFVTLGQFDERRTSALFDPEYYRTMNPATRLDVRNGNYASLLEGFCANSDTHDVPFSPDFDLAFYKASYPDIVPDGYHVRSVAHHFLFFGVREGRNPNPYFDHAYFAQRYPWIGEQCQKLSITLLEYFLLIGRHENMRAARPLADRNIDMLQAKALYERRAKDALTRSQRHPVDFTPLNNESPVLSVIVPVHNQASFTARFLELAFFGAAELKRRSGQTMEVIVVSNGSSDTTAELLAATSGIKYVDEAKALGYPGAANLGAGMATGELIVVVNNDIEFEPSVFADLVESYFRIPNCGAIGPRILSMDLTIQEIGAFIAGDGNSFGFGRGERSSYNAIERVEQVDYVSGCFLCLSRTDFESLGGFDPIFSPGYYEEVDLCFRLNEALGKQVYVDSAITITHYEHASFMKGRPPTVSHPTILRNRKRLLKKHSKLGARPTIDKIMGAAGLARLGVAKSRILVIEDLVPDPRLGSGFGRAAEVLRTFHKMGVAYDVVAVNPTLKIDDYEFGDVMLYRNWMPGESVEAVLNRSPGIYSHIWVCRSHNLSRFYEVLKTHKDIWNTKIVCDTEAVSVQRTIELAKLQGQAPSESEIVDLVAAEFNASAIVDRFIAVNERDTGFLQSTGLRNVSIISHTVSGVVRSTRPWKERTRLLFVGAVHSPLAPNFDSLKWFLRGSAKMIAKHNQRLTFVGYWDEAILREFRENNLNARVDFLGMVSEQRLSELYEESVVALAPTRYSAGIPCKVVESMLTGIPIVMTELLADQIGISDEARGNFAVAKIDSKGEAFCQAVSRLIEDEAWWNTVRQAQIGYADSRFSHHAFDQEVRAVLEQVDVGWAY
ncbi:glycosyltransferase [Sphingomonas abietis]|uniref:Glycosyltransferase n=1 Tax=Sphingomonas abietis TaxID=3012344 RepID=A0ABY7NPC6_9SPHN|nr:glycosyltransferase [Sphingomonas abietis]WBO22432.1 glycosyltransferase [Sphingomonas abietis]